MMCQQSTINNQHTHRRRGAALNTWSGYLTTTPTKQSSTRYRNTAHERPRSFLCSATGCMQTQKKKKASLLLYLWWRVLDEVLHEVVADALLHVHPVLGHTQEGQTERAEGRGEGGKGVRGCQHVT